MKTKLFFSSLIFMCFIGAYAQTTYFSKSAGNLNLVATWGTNSNGSGTAPLNFTTAGCTYVIVNNAAPTISANWVVTGANSVVQVGDGTQAISFSVPSPRTFSATVNVMSSSTLTAISGSTISGGTVNVANSANLVIQSATAPILGALASGSTVTYSRAGAQPVANAAYDNLTLGGSGTKTLNNTTNTSVASALNIGSGFAFQINTNILYTLSLNGTLTGAGTITGGASSNLSIGGTGAFGTIIPTAAPLTLNTFIVNRASLGSVTLGGNVTVSTVCNFSNGVLVLNGKTLILNGTLTLPASSANGTMTGSATSILSIGATSITNPLVLTAGGTSLNNFTLNSLGQTLTMGSNISVAGAFTHTAGILALNGKTFSLSGTVTFALSTKGTISGSTASNLLITTTTITDSLFMTAGSQTLNNFTINSTLAGVRTLNLGTSLTVAGAFTQTKGIVKLNGQTLTLNGTVIFPTVSTQGTITGSTTSNLLITASTITNSLFLTAGGTTLNNFTLNSPGKTLTLGSALTVSGAFNHTNGQINLNGQTMVLGGTITFPSAYANGSITGSTTPTLSITATSITNSLFMDQTTPGTSNMLKTFVFNSTGQTLALGNDLKDSIYTHTAGIVNLNGNTLTLTGATTFALSTKGTISGSATSNLLLSSTTITDSLFMTAGSQTLNNFTLNSATAAVRTLILGTPLTVGGAFNQTKGIIKLNGQTLTLNGTAAFSSASAQGTITGSATSNLSINASSITTNTLFLTAGGTTLNNFTLNSPSQTLIIGSAMIVSGAFNQTNGKLSLNGLALTLGGTVTFPAAYSNGSIIGSAAPTLSITATSITNSLFMDQTTPGTTNEVKILVLNSAGQTLTLGNNLMVVTGGTYTHTKGTVNLNGQTLTLNGAITFATPIANGGYTGSSASSINIGGAAAGAITNSLLMNQTSSATNSLSNLTLNRTTKTLTLGNALNMIDSISPTAGTLAGGGNITLIADQSMVGHVGRIGRVGGSITGNITSQVYHNPPPGNTTNWMLMGAAGVTNEHFSDWANTFLITCPSGCSSDGSAQNGGTPFASVTTYVENTDLFPAITGTASVITPGVGYWVFMGDSYYGNSSSPELITVTGIPKTGNFTWPTLTSTGSGADKGYNLLSNPYPSPISWSKVMARNAALAAANPSLSTLNIYSATYNGGDYLTYNASSGIGVPSYAVGTNAINDVIPAGGGFYVITTAASITTLSVTETDKVSGNNHNFLFRENGKPTSQTSSTPYISLVVSGINNSSSEAAIAFSPNAITGIDSYDSPALAWNGVLQVTTISQGANYAINALPPLTQNYAVPVKILSGTTTQCTITPMHIQNIASGACLNLHDNYTNMDYNMRQGPITVTVNDTETVARFVLNISIDPTLSVTGNSLNPTCTNSTNGYMIATASGAAPWNYYWKDGVNNIIKTSLNKMTPDTLYNANAGNYSVDINTVGSCNNGTVAYTLQGSQSSSAAFAPSSYTVTMVNDTAVVVFTNSSTNADTYMWDFGDGSQTNVASPSYSYTGPGDYMVTLTASNQACGDLSVYTQVITVDTASFTTGIKPLTSNEKNMQINRDEIGYYVQFNYSTKTNAIISVQNLLGEKIVTDIKQDNISNNKTYILLGNTENNLLIISVITSSGEKTFRKVVNY
jgi:hypothetical protein